VTAYRIVQEALTNVLRHAQATSATIQVRYQGDALEVEVDDDGCGVVPPSAATDSFRPADSPVGNRQIRRPGHGLTVMAERAAAVGGRLEAGPRPTGGFRVHARLPLGEGAA
jgi:signal transduction histidine kinase